MKHSYVKGTKACRKISADINYVQYRKDDDREKGAGARPFHTSDRDDMTGDELKQQVREEFRWGDVIHKVIVSPGDNKVDLKEYTREVMGELGRAKGQELQYAFVIHKNTDHHHAHVIVLGRDADGSRVKLDKLDHLRMRAFGDRYLERELNLERVLDKDMERFCRDRGLNVMFERERGEYFYERLYKGDPKRDKDKSLDPERDVREWAKFDSDWAGFVIKREGMEKTFLGKSSFHDIGRQADLHEFVRNNEQTDLWRNIAENKPEMKEEAEKMLAALEGERLEIEQAIQERTKAYDPWRVIDDVARRYDAEAVELRELIDGPVKHDIDLDRLFEISIKSDDKEISLDRLLGFEKGADKDLEPNPLLGGNDDLATQRGQELDNLLGFSSERFEVDRGIEAVETYGVPNIDSDPGRDDDSEKLWEIGW